MQIIPFKEPAQWQEQIELDTQTFVLSFRWNAMNEYWVMDILTRDLVPII
ncbi:phage baseplate plug family protein, partial [Staphylococcus aureus]